MKVTAYLFSIQRFFFYFLETNFDLINLSYDVEKKFIKLDRNVNCFQSVFCSDQDLRISLLLVFLKVAKSRKGTKGGDCKYNI